MPEKEQDNLLKEEHSDETNFARGVSVATVGQVQKSRGMTRKTSSLIFYILMMTVPVIQFVLMYFCVNINSILLSFKEYTPSGDFVWLQEPFANFKEVFAELASDRFHVAIENSLLAFVFSLLINIPLSLFFSYYIYKKFVGHNVFRVALYLPNIISSIVMVTIYYYIMDDAIPHLWASLFGGREPEGLISNPNTAMPSLIAFTVLFSFGSITMVFASSMSSINESVIEASRLDGCNLLQEFIFIIFPLTFNVIKLQLLATLVGIFTNQLSLYTFFDVYADPSLYTIGYYLYRGTVYEGVSGYPFYAAMGLVLTLIAIPVILSIRKLFDRFDPYVSKGEGK